MKKHKKHRWSGISRRVFNDRPAGWSAVSREAAEILEELAAGNFRAALVEVRQVWFFLQLFVHQRTGIDFPCLLVGPVVRDFLARLSVWEDIFHREGLEFNVDYLVGGSNYNRPRKVGAALALAREDQAA